MNRSPKLEHLRIAEDITVPKHDEYVALFDPSLCGEAKACVILLMPHTVALETEPLRAKLASVGKVV